MKTEPEKKGEKGMRNIRNINIKGMSRDQWLNERRKGIGGRQ